MRLIIRDDPTAASAYIAKYIIGNPYHPALAGYSKTKKTE